MVRKLSNKAPIILTWVPRVFGASLPDGKNSTLNYLDIIKNHKLINKEERDIYLVINGPGFKQNQIDDLKRELEVIEGVHIVDLHQYDWSKIDKGWKIDDKDISIKDFFKNMYDMQEEQRIYFAIEIDTFRLIALALLKQISKQRGGIYVDFDSLSNIKGHIGRDITIPEGILLGQVTASVNKRTGKIIKTNLNNDLVAISPPSIAVDILSQYKSKILSQKEMCYELAERLSKFVQKEKSRFFTVYKELGKKQLVDDEKKKKGKSVIEKLDKIERKIGDIRNGKIRALYEPPVLEHMRYREIDMNLGQIYTVAVVSNKLIGEEVSKRKPFVFEENNGNYVSIENDDLSWMKGEDLYHKQVDSKLEETKADQTQATEKLPSA